MPVFEDKAIKFLRNTEPTTITPTLMLKKLKMRLYMFIKIYIYIYCILVINIYTLVHTKPYLAFIVKQLIQTIHVRHQIHVCQRISSVSLQVFYFINYNLFFLST